jgi:pyridoxine 4-dehydrogenase
MTGISASGIRREPTGNVRTPVPLTGQVALGGAGFSLAEHVDDAAATATIHAALQAGVRVFDCARAYAPVGDPTHNERLFARALSGLDDVLIDTKGGHFRTGTRTWDVDNSPERLARDVDDSLAALGVEQIGLYYLHRADGRARFFDPAADPEPIAESVAALDAIRRSGKIAAIGISNVTVAQLDEAVTIAPIAAVQNLHSAVGLESADVLRRCEELGIAFFAYSPLRGALSRSRGVDRFPRTSAAAARRGVSLARILLRALLASSPVLSVVSGAQRVTTAIDSCSAAVEPWDDELAQAFSDDHELSRGGSSD